MSDLSYKTKTIRAEVTFQPVTRFEFVDNGIKFIGYIDEPFDRFDDSEFNAHIKDRIHVGMGYRSNIIYLIKKERYDSPEQTIPNMNDEAVRELVEQGHKNRTDVVNSSQLGFEVPEDGAPR